MRKTKKIYLFMIIIAALVAGSGCLTAPNSYSQEKESSVFSGLVITAEEAKPFKINATIMEIHEYDSPPNINVAERTIVIKQYKYNNNVITPRLLDRNGDLIEINDLKKESRVVVIGLELEDETIVAESVTVQADE